MNCSQLLNRTLASRLVCETNQIAIGPTGPVGGTATIPGALKAFTIFVDYSAAPTNPISRIYIPPGLFSSTAEPILSVGGVFTANVGTDLLFIGQANPGQIIMNNMMYPFAAGLSANGYTDPGLPNAPCWQIVAQRNILPGANNIGYTIPNDYSLVLSAPLAPINGGQTASKPATGTATGFLATITIFFI